jgi:5,10-methylenetetrahydrofolate reductase
MRLSDLAKSGHFIRIVEVFPPAIPAPKDFKTAQKFDLGLRFDRLVQGLIRTEPFADGFSLPELKDGNRIHLNSVGVANELRRRTGSAVIPTITLRDTNRQGVFGMITYALFAGIENILFVRGDPFENGSSQNPKNVYDIGKLSNLIALARKIESHIASANPLCILSPINLAKSDDESYLKTIRERELCGVDIFVGEQMFEDLNAYLGRVEKIRKYGIRKPIVHSIFPLKDYEDAIGLVQKFGWGITDFELANLKNGGSRYGIEMARERYRSLLRHRDLIQGVSVSTRGNPEVARYIFR